MKKLIIAISFIIGMSLSGIAQPTQGIQGNGNSTGGSSLNGNGGGAPIDGGISILIALGAALAGKKVYKFQKNEI